MLRQTCEPESLFFEVPHLFAVHDEVAEFMRAVEARPCPVVFVCAEYDDRMVRKGREKASTSAIWRGSRMTTMPWSSRSSTTL
jgi:hypothetical protein